MKLEDVIEVIHEALVIYSDESSILKSVQHLSTDTYSELELEMKTGRRIPPDNYSDNFPDTSKLRLSTGD